MYELHKSGFQESLIPRFSPNGGGVSNEAVLVAIAIPVFTSQLEKSREATDAANVRSAYAEVVTKYLTDNDDTFTIAVESKQGQADWQGDQPSLTYQGGGASTQGTYPIPASTDKGGTYTVGIEVDEDTGAATPSVTYSAS